MLTEEVTIASSESRLLASLVLFTFTILHDFQLHIFRRVYYICVFLEICNFVSRLMDLHVYMYMYAPTWSTKYVAALCDCIVCTLTLYRECRNQSCTFSLIDII